MKHKAKIKGTEKEIEGVHIKNKWNDYIISGVIDANNQYITIEKWNTIKPETLQVQLTNGDWCNVDEVEVVRKGLFEKLQSFAIWLTGCGYYFTQHEYYKKMKYLLTLKNKSK